MNIRPFAAKAVLVTVAVEKSTGCFQWQTCGFDTVNAAIEALQSAPVTEPTSSDRESIHDDKTNVFFTHYKAVIRIGEKTALCPSKVVMDSGIRPPICHLQPGVSSVCSLAIVFDNLKSTQVRQRLAIVANDASYVGSACSLGLNNFERARHALKPLADCYNLVVRDSLTWMYVTLVLVRRNATETRDLRWIVEFRDNGWTFRVVPDHENEYFSLGCINSEEHKFKKDNGMPNQAQLPAGFATALAFAASLRHYAQICSRTETVFDPPLVWDVEPYRKAMIEKE